MKKKFPAADIKCIINSYDYDHLGFENKDISGDLQFVEEGEWEAEDTDTQCRRTIFKEISTGKCYMFEEEADVAVDTFISIWENYPDIKEIECAEVIPEVVTVTKWKKVEN